MRTILLCSLTAILGTIAGSWIAQAQTPETMIRTEDSTIIFIVNGQEQARIDNKGLFVRGDVAFTGMTVDIGTYPVQAGAQ